MAGTGVRTDRFLLSWRAVQPSEDSFNWGPTDNLVGRLASRGIRPLPFVWGSPRWVTTSPHRPPLGTAFAEQAWSKFLRLAVARYKPGGSYWANGYLQQYGAGATPLPITSWQIWNEPNLQKYFDPAGTAAQAAQKYGRLLQISHDAIKSRDQDAKIVLAGLLGEGDPRAWDFLYGLYNVPGINAPTSRLVRPRCTASSRSAYAGSTQRPATPCQTQRLSVRCRTHWISWRTTCVASTRCPGR